MIEAKIQDQLVQVEEIEGLLRLSGENSQPDLIHIGDGKSFHLLHKNQSVFVELVSFDKDTKTCKWNYRGHIIEVQLKDRYDQLLHQLGFDKMLAKGTNEVKAPMPGLVLSIKVEAGQEVKKGDPVLILEAMKMENVIKSPTDGVVKEIKISERDAVDKNQTLIVFN